MRVATAPELAVLAANTYRVTPRLKVANGSGTMIDLTSWMESATWDQDIDQPVAGATVEFRRDFGSTLSFAPFRSDSTLNRDDSLSYSPQLDVGRRITIEVATTALGTAPIAGDYKLMFSGTIDVVNFEHSPVSVTARDDGGLLVDRWISFASPMGSADGMALELVMQNLLTGWVLHTLDPVTVTLNVPVSPGFLITTYNQQPQSVMDALFALAATIGWDVRYRYDEASGTFKLTLQDPNRSKTVPDYTFGPDRYFDVRTLNIDRTNIRNYIEVIYIDSGNTGTVPGTGTITSTAGVAVFSVAQTKLAYGLRVIVAGTPYTISSIVTSTLVGLDGAPTFGASAFSFSNTASEGSVAISDPTSIARYGLRYFKIQEGAGSPIDSAPEAASLANTVLSDLKDPKAEQEIEMPFFWPADLGDLYRFSPNSVHYNSAQDYAVVRVEHKLSMTEHRTTIRTRGSPAGAYLSWLNRSSGHGIVPAPGAFSLNDFKILSETSTTITYSWNPGVFVAEVWAADVLFTEPVPVDPWSYVLSAEAPLPSGTTTYTVSKVAEGQVRLVQLEPRDSDLTPGTVQRVVVNAPATQPPIIELDDIETNTVGTQWWKLTERGIAVLSVMVQTQVGIQPISGFLAPTRSAGAASSVRGGTLGAGEYEQDVDLDPTRQSWIMPQITLVNGSPPIILGPFGFDRNKLPNILSVKVTGTVVDILSDSDTKSIKITNSSLSWIYQTDGVFLTVDVSKTGTNGAAGLGASSSDTYTITAQSDALIDVGGGTTTDVRAVTILGVSAPPASAVWDTPGVTVTAPPTNGSRDLTVTLKATAAPVGWTAEAWLSFYSSHGTDNRNNVSAGFTPSTLTTPPIVSTDYHYNATGFKRASGGSTVTASVTCYLKDGGGVIQDTKIANASWQTDFT